MVTSQEIPSSSCLTNSSLKSDNESDQIDKLSARNNSLVVCGHQLSWEGNIEQLKHFTCTVLKLTGKWKSLGGDVKIF